MIKEYPKVETILRLLAAGVVLSTMFISPHLLIAIATTYTSYAKWKKFSRPRLKRSIDRLRKRKLVKLIERNNETFIELTDLGREEIIHYDINNINLTSTGHWDKKWWMVIFDIPEKYRKQRVLFQSKLKFLGFHFIQKSVCLYPYSCQKEIEFLREVYRIKKWVNIIKVDTFETEYLVKEKFNL